MSTRHLLSLALSLLLTSAAVLMYLAVLTNGRFF